MSETKYQDAWLNWVDRVSRKLEPGLELDKLIAEKVSGWYQFGDIGGPRAQWFEKGEGGGIQENALYLNHFSTDIKAAWDLAEKFRLTVSPFGKTGWTAVKKWCDDEMVMLQNSSPIAPHAICLAALFYASEGDE